jgi:hypothetical protein
MIAAIVIIVMITCLFLFNVYSDTFEASYNRVELNYQGKPNLYIKIKNWGVSGDKQITVITTENETQFEVDSSNQIVFDGLEPFLYRQERDTLILYVRREVIVPAGFNQEWIIIQHEIDNSEWTKRRSDYRNKKI